MNILLVLDHPVRDSFCGALADAVQDGAHAAGHRIDFLDLARADFDCQFQPADHAYFLGGPVPRDVAAMHRRVEAADALVFVYAMEPQGNRPLLRDRPVALVASAGASRQTIEDFGYGPAMRRLIDEGTFGYCGLATVYQLLVPDVHESAQARATGLAAAKALPRRMFGS